MNLCQKCMGTKKLILGALLLINAFLWPKWTGLEGSTNWISFIAVLMVIGGFLMIVVPNKCSSCMPCVEVPAAKKKRKRR